MRRQIAVLSADHEVTAAGFSDPAIEGVQFVDVSAVRPKDLRQKAAAGLRLKLRRYESYYWGVGHVVVAREALVGRAYDLIVANEPDTWPLAFALRGDGTRVLLDAHEYAPREFEEVRRWRLFYQRYRRHACATFLPRADAVTTVCEGIAAEYERCFGVRPAVVMNAPPRRDLTPSPVAADRVRMIHHGSAIQARRIEAMIHMVDHLDERFSLDLMLVGQDTAYIASLKQLAASRPRVRFRDPVPMHRLPEETREYDVGVALLEPTSFNHLHALPNKFFEFVQARLAVAVGPSPEMAGLVREHGCGVVAGDFRPAALASELRALTPESLARLKENAHCAADVLCWEREGEKLLAVVRSLLG